jgi:2-dehydro-3-deoxygluconokinase
MMKPEIVSIGEPLIEFGALDEAPLSEVKQFKRGYGGDTSNFVIAVSRLGGKAGYLTRLGDDEFAESFLKLWAEEGVDTRHIAKDSAAYTGMYFIARMGPKHDFTYLRQNSAASRMTPEFLPADYIRQARLLHVSGISQCISTSACDTVFSAIAIAKEAKAKISYDPNLRLKLWPIHRAKAIIHQTISMADIVLPSIEDARALNGKKSAEEIVRLYLALGPEVVVLKLGAEGSLLATREKTEAGLRLHTRKFEPYKVDSKDMTGAGDTFDGAFVVGYLAGWPLERCMRFANAAAALTTTELGAVAPIPRLKAVEDLMAQQPI